MYQMSKYEQNPIKLLNMFQSSEIQQETAAVAARHNQEITEIQEPEKN